MRPTKTKTKRERERESKREKKEERIRRRKSELWRQRSLTSRIAINGKCSSVHWNVYIHDWFYIYATKLSCSCGTFFAHSAIRWPLLFVFCLSLTGRFHGLTRASYEHRHVFVSLRWDCCQFSPWVCILSSSIGMLETTMAVTMIVMMKKIRLAKMAKN